MSFYYFGREGSGLTHIYIMRHGVTEWNCDGNRFCGRSDVELSEMGQRQADQAARFLQHVAFSAIYASPLQRAIATAAPTARMQELDIRQDERITEIDFGEWDGVRGGDIQRQFATQWEMWWDDPTDTQAGGTGETAGQVFERMNRFVQEKAERHKGENVLVVGHSTAIRIYLAGMLAMPLRSYQFLVHDNTGITVIAPGERGMRLLHMNCRYDTFSKQPNGGGQ
jgi:broad specificity phosphatase PhoE